MEVISALGEPVMQLAAISLKLCLPAPGLSQCLGKAEASPPWLALWENIRPGTWKD